MQRQLPPYLLAHPNVPLVWVWTSGTTDHHGTSCHDLVDNCWSIAEIITSNTPTPHHFLPPPRIHTRFCNGMAVVMVIMVVVMVMSTLLILTFFVKTFCHKNISIFSRRLWIFILILRILYLIRHCFYYFDNFLVKSVRGPERSRGPGVQRGQGGQGLSFKLRAAKPKHRCAEPLNILQEYIT